MTYTGENEKGSGAYTRARLPFPTGSCTSWAPCRKTDLDGCSTAGSWMGRMRSQIDVGRQEGRWVALSTI